MAIWETIPVHSIKNNNNISPSDCPRAFKRLRSGAQDRRKVNRIAGDSNAHRIKDILPDDIAVKCLPISGAKFSCDRFRHALLRDLRKMDVQQLYLHLGSNDILTNEAVFYRVVCSNDDALLSHFCSRHIKQPETGKESKIKLIGSPMIASANHELNKVSSRKWKACLEIEVSIMKANFRTYKHFPPTMWIKMFGLMILGRMCGQGGLHYIMMQLCIQQHVYLSQRMLMLLNDVE
ncbi:hypothetical protein DPMN_096413 [Dreissena polymorpha]|uniref:Uncharacterized protein n=1 Tax=Dreissena polymorpha TaxID=45954 RepID=A0A9D4L9Q1_DREPO|nr:hypothetical protein DPMN_096413 [Dreissena polymorpha]